MCRFLLYKGKEPILLADLLTRPEHSMVHQSFDSKLRVDKRRPLNGDGFGIGWYQEERPNDTAPERQNELLKMYSAKDGPCIFTSILPAWTNFNLIRLSEKIQSKLVFAHVRAASPGFPITETNCHPWSYGRFLFMHNGYISGFSKIKRKLQSVLRDELYLFVQGNTDSEWIFALFLNQFDDPLNGDYGADKMSAALLKVINILNLWCKEAGVIEPSLMNFAVSNGSVVAVTRYVNSKTMDPASLFYSTGSKFEAVSCGVYKMVTLDRRENLIIVSSEPLTYERNDWISVPANSLLVINEKLNLLTYPILDDFYTEEERAHSSASENLLTVS
ncbi:hypothetical protein MP638_000843 [Amoeboaphelidium occidentale]|nr:hypothetical protein MP638_000843 [Amoeboaphelidium occidentale]